MTAGIPPLNPIVADALTFLEALEECQPPAAPWPEWLTDLKRLALVDKFKLESVSQPRDESFAGGPDALEQDALDAEVHIFHAAKAFAKEARKPWPAWTLLWEKN